MKCKDCKKEMQTAKSCSFTHFVVDGKYVKRVTSYHDGGVRCHDCGIVNGNVHHDGCDMERCPKCNGQAAFCDCNITAVARLRKKVV